MRGWIYSGGRRSGSFQPEEYQDRFLANLRELIASKQAGRKPTVVVKAERPQPAQDLFAALSASVAAAKKDKGKKAA